MLIFVVYLFVFVFLIYRGKSLSVFNDDLVSRKKFAVLFILKAVAVPAFYFLFLKLYGGIQHFDAGKFLFDAQTIGNLAHQNFPEYLKVLFGLQDETEGSHFYKMIIEPTFNWENGAEKDFFYNDNRVVIRIHSIIHLISFGSYYVHALIACFFSYIGIVLMYKSFKDFFAGREKWLLFILCFFPSLWLYTGALLKEPWCVFFLGAIIYSLKQVAANGFSLKRILVLLVLFSVSLILKPYILFFTFISAALFYLIQLKVKPKFRLIFFLGIAFLMAVLVNVFVLQTKKLSLYEVARGRLLRFEDVAKGGIFLTDEKQLIRVDYNWNLLRKDSLKKNHFRINKGTAYVYWEYSHKNDTLYTNYNLNTSTGYSLAYVIPKAGSNVKIVQDNMTHTLINCLYYSMAHPLFFNAKGFSQILASVENFLLIVAMLLFLVRVFSSTKESFPAFFFFFLSVSLFLLIGFTTPNSGAILRYRAPIAVFLLFSGLYYLNKPKIKSGI